MNVFSGFAWLLLAVSSTLSEYFYISRCVFSICITILFFCLVLTTSLTCLAVFCRIHLRESPGCCHTVISNCLTSWSCNYQSRLLVYLPQLSDPNSFISSQPSYCKALPSVPTCVAPGCLGSISAAGFVNRSEGGERRAYDSMPRGKSWLMATVALKFFLLSLHTSSLPR